MNVKPDLTANLPSEQVVFDHVREMDAADAQRQSANGVYRSRRKDAKGAKINLEALDFVRKKLGKYTGQELVDFANHIIHYARVLRVPTFRDLPLFANVPQTEDEIAREAYERGVVAGKSGETTNPWSEGTPLHMAFERGVADAAGSRSKGPDLRVVADALDDDDDEAGVM